MVFLHYEVLYSIKYLLNIYFVDSSVKLYGEKTEGVYPQKAYTMDEAMALNTHGKLGNGRTALKTHITVSN